MKNTKGDKFKLEILEAEIERLRRRMNRNYSRITAIKFANSKLAKQVAVLKNIVQKVKYYE